MNQRQVSIRSLCCRHTTRPNVENVVQQCCKCYGPKDASRVQSPNMASKAPHVHWGRSLQGSRQTKLAPPFVFVNRGACLPASQATLLVSDQTASVHMQTSVRPSASVEGSQVMRQQRAHGKVRPPQNTSEKSSTMASFSARMHQKGPCGRSRDETSIAERVILPITIPHKTT